MRATLVSALLSISSLASGLEWSDNHDGDFSTEKFAEANSLRNRRVWNRPIKRQSGWSPPSDISTPLQEVWDHCIDTYSSGLYGFKNYGWDQLMATDGKLNMCVRWESSALVTEAQRTQIATAINTQYQQWFEWLYGYDSFPFSKIEVNVVGWAVSDASKLEGSTDGIEVYTDTDADGIPQCAEACGRFFHNDGDYSGCAAGADKHYDQSLWLTEGMSGGAGGDWGQRIGSEYMINALGSDSVHILLHEMGHTFGLDDFYDWTPTGISSFVMLAGSATTITDFDGWMLRNWWYELSRNRGWQSGSGSSSSTASASAPAATATATATASSAPTSVDSPDTTSVVSPDTTSTTYPDTTSIAYPDTTSIAYPDTTSIAFPGTTPVASSSINYPEATSSANSRSTGSRTTSGSGSRPTSGVERPSCGKSRRSFKA
ncbi:unnamed protein product [Clonostachys solani]|uniref:Uncharacterized protein n=1 Tax=Clonostachys solani TaxID=160281 RepID=A0A9N9ZDS3_9HYPO|nr:unnamed protein product [Clonostachys solani]